MPGVTDYTQEPGWSYLGFAGGRTDYGMLVMGGLPPMTTRGRYVFIPFWFLAAAAGAPPALAAVRWRRGRQVCPGLCPTCGYDLRATPGRYPECGTVPKTKGATA